MAERGNSRVGYEVLFGDARIALGSTPLTVGRSPDCQIMLDSNAVSRRHAKLGLREGAPVLRDLGSANGVFVNGKRIRDEHPLAVGDVILIGDQELRVAARAVEDDPAISRTADTAVGLKASWDEAAQDATADAQETTGRRDSIALMGQVADRLMDTGEVNRAADLISAPLRELLARLQQGAQPGESTVLNAARCGLRLAEASEDPAWANYVVDLYAATRAMMPDEVIVTLHQLVRKLRRVGVAQLEAYIAMMQQSALAPHDRFLLRRLESLLRVAKERPK